MVETFPGFNLRAVASHGIRAAPDSLFCLHLKIRFDHGKNPALDAVSEYPANGDNKNGQKGDGLKDETCHIAHREECIHCIRGHGKWHGAEEDGPPDIQEDLTTANVYELGDISRPEYEVHCQTRQQRSHCDPVDAKLTGQNNAESQICDCFGDCPLRNCFMFFDA